MTEKPSLDDAKAVAKATQSRQGRRGRSIWWFLAIAIVAVAVLVFAASLHRTAPAEQGTTPVGGVASSNAAPNSATP